MAFSPFLREAAEHLPTGWTVAALPEVTDFQEGPGILAKDFRESGVPLLRLRNVEGASVRLEGSNFLDPHMVGKKWDHFRLKSGDLLISTSATFGRVSVVTPEAEGAIAYTGLIRFRPASKHLTYGYLRAFLGSELFRLQAESSASGSVIRHFGPSHLKQMAIILPPLAEQDAITRVHSGIENKLSILRETNATLEAIAQTLFKSWFVDFDPVHAKADGRDPEGVPPEVADLFPSEFENSELGGIPLGWRAQCLIQACEINPTRRIGKGTESPYLEMSAVPTKGHRPELPFIRSFSSGTKFVNGDTLLARITPCLENGKSAFVDFLMEGEVGWGSTEFIVLRPRNPLPDYWGYLLCRHEPFRQFAIQAMVGTSGRQRVEVSRLAQYPVAIPTIGIATAFGHIVEPLRVKIASNDDEVKTLSGLRDTLLPRLMSGKLRIPSEQEVSA